MLAYAAKSVKDDSGHLHDEGNGQFTSGGGGGGKGKLKRQTSGARLQQKWEKHRQKQSKEPEGKEPERQGGEVAEQDRDRLRDALAQEQYQRQRQGGDEDSVSTLAERKVHLSDPALAKTKIVDAVAGMDTDRFDPPQLEDIYQAVRNEVPDLGRDDFKTLLCQLRVEDKLRLVPFTRAVQAIPKPEGAFVGDGEIMNYATVRKSMSTKSFDESKHPRGQPENAGQFGPGGTGGGEGKLKPKEEGKPASQGEAAPPKEASADKPASKPPTLAFKGDKEDPHLFLVSKDASGKDKYVWKEDVDYTAELSAAVRHRAAELAQGAFATFQDSLEQWEQDERDPGMNERTEVFEETSKKVAAIVDLAVEQSLDSLAKIYGEVMLTDHEDLENLAAGVKERFQGALEEAMDAADNKDQDALDESHDELVRGTEEAFGELADAIAAYREEVAQAMEEQNEEDDRADQENVAEYLVGLNEIELDDEDHEYAVEAAVEANRELEENSNYRVWFDEDSGQWEFSHQDDVDDYPGKTSAGQKSLCLARSVFWTHYGDVPMTKSLSVIPLLRNKPGLLGRIKSHDKHRAKRRGMEVSQAAQTLGRLGGKIGGPARARKLSAARRSEIAKQGGRARQGKSLGTLSF